MNPRIPLIVFAASAACVAWVAGYAYGLAVADRDWLDRPENFDDPVYRPPFLP